MSKVAVALRVRAARRPCRGGATKTPEPTEAITARESELHARWNAVPLLERWRIRRGLQQGTLPPVVYGALVLELLESVDGLWQRSLHVDARRVVAKIVAPIACVVLVCFPLLTSVHDRVGHALELAGIGYATTLSVLQLRSILLRSHKAAEHARALALMRAAAEAQTR